GEDGMLAVIPRTEHPILFAVEGNEDDAASRAGRQAGEDRGGFDERGDPTGVVVRAVEDAVSGSTRPDAEVIVVSGDQDEGVLKRRVGARQPPDHVARAAPHSLATDLVTLLEVAAALHRLQAPAPELIRNVDRRQVQPPRRGSAAF